MPAAVAPSRGPLRTKANTSITEKKCLHGVSVPKAPRKFLANWTEQVLEQLAFKAKIIAFVFPKIRTELPLKVEERHHESFDLLVWAMLEKEVKKAASTLAEELALRNILKDVYGLGNGQCVASVRADNVHKQLINFSFVDQRRKNPTEEQTENYLRAESKRNAVLNSVEEIYSLPLERNANLIEKVLGQRSWQVFLHNDAPAVAAKNAGPRSSLLVKEKDELRLFSGQLQWLRDTLAKQTKVTGIPTILNHGVSVKAIPDLLFLAVAVPGFVAREIRAWSLDQLAENLLGGRSLARDCGIKRALKAVGLVRAENEVEPRPLLAGGSSANINRRTTPVSSAPTTPQTMLQETLLADSAEDAGSCFAGGGCCEDADTARVGFAKLFLLLHFIRNSMPRSEASRYANVRGEIVSSYDPETRNALPTLLSVKTDYKHIRGTKSLLKSLWQCAQKDERVKCARESGGTEDACPERAYFRRVFGDKTSAYQKFTIHLIKVQRRIFEYSSNLDERVRSSHLLRVNSNCLTVTGAEFQVVQSGTTFEENGFFCAYVVCNDRIFDQSINYMITPVDDRGRCRSFSSSRGHRSPKNVRLALPSSALGVAAIRFRNARVSSPQRHRKL